MKATELTHIQYEKATNIGGAAGEITERYVIPTFVPNPNIKALDVTDLSEAERVVIQQAYAEYTDYYTQAVKSLFNFEDWLSHTKGDDIDTSDIKWRTFKMDNVKVLG